MNNDFVSFPKIARLSRDVVITEKLDGTNASIWIDRPEDVSPASQDIIGFVVTEGAPAIVRAGSRNRFIVPGRDNFGFATWVEAHLAEIADLGIGVHHGEWWGKGIGRGYGLTEKRFSLFNTSRWLMGVTRPDGEDEWVPTAPLCCHVVPLLYVGPFETGQVESSLNLLRAIGSVAAPGFDKPEGVVVYHTAANVMFKKTFEHDNEGKWAA